MPSLPISLYRSPFAGAKFTDFPLQIPPYGQMAKKRQKDRKTERQKNRQTDRQTERQKDRKTERQKDRKTERQKDRKTERQKCETNFSSLLEFIWMIKSAFIQ